MSSKVLFKEVLANIPYTFKRHEGIWKTREKGNNKTKHIESFPAMVLHGFSTKRGSLPNPMC